MPSDLIYREDAKDYARHAMAKGLNVLEYLGEVPAADFRPVVKGKWENTAEHDARVAELQRWIPVTERLPEYGDWVLGIGPKHGYHVCEYRGITHFPYSGDSPWFAAKGRSLTITHWMPLPEPPKEET